MTEVNTDITSTGAGPRMRREIIIRLGRLLNMSYKPTELANEIGVNVDTIHRTYLKAGCPFYRDRQGQVWIIGTDFREWALQVANQSKNTPGRNLSDGEAWCLRCRKPVKMIDPKKKHVNRYLEMLQGTCAVCGGRVNRARARGQS